MKPICDILLRFWTNSCSAQSRINFHFWQGSTIVIFYMDFINHIIQYILFQMKKVVATTVLWGFYESPQSCFCCRVFDKFPIFCFSVSMILNLLSNSFTKISDDSITEVWKVFSVRWSIHLYFAKKIPFRIFSFAVRFLSARISAYSSVSSAEMINLSSFVSRILQMWWLECYLGEPLFLLWGILIFEVGFCFQSPLHKNKKSLATRNYRLSLLVA